MGISLLLLVVTSPLSLQVWFICVGILWGDVEGSLNLHLRHCTSEVSSLALSPPPSIKFCYNSSCEVD